MTRPRSNPARQKYQHAQADLRAGENNNEGDELDGKQRVGRHLARYAIHGGNGKQEDSEHVEAVNVLALALDP